MAMDISRRSFLKGAAASAAALAATAIPGAAVLADSENKAAEITVAAPAAMPAGFAPTGKDCTYGAYLNPQDPSGFADSGDLSHLFSPLKIGHVTLKNRIVKSAAGSEMQDNTVWPSDAALAYYGQFCDGGVGMVCYEASTVVPLPTGAMGGIPGMPTDGAPAGMPADAAGMPGMPADASGDMPAGMPGMPEGGDGVSPTPAGVNSLDITTDEGIPAHKAIADYMHAKGTPLIGQLYDMLMAGGASSTAVHEFEMETSFASGKMQTTEEVQAEIQCFIDAAERYYKAGYDGVEINCSCSHYFSTFLSRFANNERTDQYSGETIENRARIVTEVIEGIRARVGSDFIIQVLYSGAEENVAHLGHNDACTTVEEACEFAKLFEKAGASCLHIRSQAYGHHCAGFMPDVLHIQEHGHTGYGTIMDYGKHFAGVQGQYDGFGALIEVAARIKSCVSIPVGAVGAMDPRVTPDLIDRAIADGKMDYILVTRPLMADPQYCNKLQAGQKEDIARLGVDIVTIDGDVARWSAEAGIADGEQRSQRAGRAGEAVLEIIGGIVGEHDWVIDGRVRDAQPCGKIAVLRFAGFKVNARCAGRRGRCRDIFAQNAAVKRADKVVQNGRIRFGRRDDRRFGCLRKLHSGTQRFVLRRFLIELLLPAENRQQECKQANKKEQHNSRSNPLFHGVFSL